MFRVAIIINENEVSHSKYADTLNTLKSAIDGCNESGKKGNSYHFITFDKFNIDTLFSVGSNNIMTFHGIVIATNALNNTEIHEAFCKNKQSVEDFLNANKGIFISSQKKLRNKLQDEEIKSIEFLPEYFECFLFERSEDSKDGGISIHQDIVKDRLVSYPYQITDEIIKSHCEENKFVPHKYNSLIIPKNSNSFETILHDNTSEKISQNELGYNEGDRKLLLCSRNNKRIVISTIVLDWANHNELLCNILSYITTDKSLAIFVKKESEQTENSIIDSYVIRANTSNLPYRVISEGELENYKKMSGTDLIFSPQWTTEEVETIYQSKLENPEVYFSLYHISSIDNAANIKFCKYSNFSSIDTMKDDVIREIICDYSSNKWNKSVWTYNYIAKLIDFFDISVPNVIPKVYEELGKHFTKNGKLVGHYDNIVNATCKMLELLHYFVNKYGKDNFATPFPIEKVIEGAEKWIVNKINTPNAVHDQDICYCLLYLIKCQKYNSLEANTKRALKNSFNDLIRNILTETLSSEMKNRSNIDLCRIYQTLFILPADICSDNDKRRYIETIETILKERQDSYGNWKNISETSEITTMLLEVYENRMIINNNNDSINVLIIRSIEALHIQFDVKTNTWNNDTNTTAKAMYAIGLYNKKFNFSINDFFGDLNQRETKFKTATAENTGKIDKLYRDIDTLHNAKQLLNQKIMADKKTIRITRTFSLFMLALSLSLLFIVGLTFIILSINYKETLYAIWADWAKYFVAGFFSLVVASVGTAIYAYFSKNIKKEV